LSAGRPTPAMSALVRFAGCRAILSPSGLIGFRHWAAKRLYCNALVRLPACGGDSADDADRQSVRRYCSYRSLSRHLPVPIAAYVVRICAALARSRALRVLWLTDRAMPLLDYHRFIRTPGLCDGQQCILLRLLRGMYARPSALSPATPSFAWRHGIAAALLCVNRDSRRLRLVGGFVCAMSRHFIRPSVDASARRAHAAPCSGWPLVAAGVAWRQRPPLQAARLMLAGPCRAGVIGLDRGSLGALGREPSTALFSTRQWRDRGR